MMMGEGDDPTINSRLEEPTHISIDIKAEPNEPSEALSPYQPQSFLSSHGDIISHDPRLNEDADAIYRFLLCHSATPPSYVLKIVGTHEERKSRSVTRTVDGQSTKDVEHYAEHVTDFDFSIDLTSYIVHGPVFWSYPDADPAYRGLMTHEVDVSSSTRRNATKQEINALKEGESARVDFGVPPWQALDGSSRAERQASAMTTRQWAEEYVASSKHLKEFVFEKVIYGWSPSKLTAAIASSIASTSYTGSVKSTFTLSKNRIYIRPANRLSRSLSSTHKVLLTMMYTVLWLWERFSSNGGGRWEVLGAAYGLVHVEPADRPGTSGDDPEPQVKLEVDAVEQQRHPLMQEPRVVDTERGPQKVTGYREGEWFGEWEATIRRCAMAGLQQREPLKHPPRNPAEALDGYVPKPATGLTGVDFGFVPIPVVTIIAGS